MIRRILTLFVVCGLLIGLSSCGKKKIPVNFEGCDLSIAMISQATGNEGSYPEIATWQALGKYMDDNNLDFECLKNVKLERDEDFPAIVDSLVYENNDLIVVAQPGFSEALKKAAEKNNEQKFLAVDFVIDKPNILNVEFAKKDAAYLLGIASALKAKGDGQNTFGFIDIDESKEYEDFRQGWQKGIKEILPNAQITQVKITNIDDPMAYKVINEVLLDSDVYVIFNPVNESIDYLFEQALIKRSRGGMVWLLGNDPSQYNLGLLDDNQSIILTSIFNDYGVAVETAINILVDGTFRGGAVNKLKFSILNDGVSINLAPDRNLSDANIDVIKNYIRKIKVGDLNLDQ